MDVFMGVNVEKIKEPIDLNSEMVASERAAKVAWALAKGEILTTQSIADKTGLTYSGAWRLMQKLERVLPIGFDDTTFVDGYWFALDKYPYKATFVEAT